jgi:hypothetical protein
MTPSQQLYVATCCTSSTRKSPFGAELCVKLQEIGGQLCEVRAALEASDARGERGRAG